MAKATAPEGFVPMRHNGKPVGHTSKDGLTYLTYRDPTVHRAWKYDSYGISVAVLDKLKERGVKNLVLIEQLPSGKIVRHEMLVEDWFGAIDSLGGNEPQVYFPIPNLPVWAEMRLQRLRDEGDTYEAAGSLGASRVPLEEPVRDPNERPDLYSVRIKQAARDGVWFGKGGEAKPIKGMTEFNLKGAINRCLKEDLRPTDQPLKALVAEAMRRDWNPAWIPEAARP